MLEKSLSQSLKVLTDTPIHSDFVIEG